MADEATNPTPNENDNQDQNGQGNAPTGADSVSNEQAPVDEQRTEKKSETAARKKAATASPNATPQGEVQVDKGSKSDILGGEDRQTNEELLNDARNDAVRNHAAHVAEQPAA